MKRISLILLSSLSLVFTSCLKDENIDDMKYGMAGLEDRPLVEFPNSPRTTTPLNASTTDTTFNLLAVRLNEPAPASEDVKITLVPNNALVTASGYAVAPSSAYTVDNLTVTVPAGQREGYLKITTKTANLADDTYAFGYTISSVSNPRYTISENYKSMIAILPVKNKYHGTYSSTGYLYHPSSAREIHMTKEVTTAGPNSVYITLGDLGSSGYIALVTVNEATNEVTIEAAPGAAGGPYTMFTSGLPTSQPGYTAAWSGSAASNNTYDPNTKTFYLRYGYMGGTGWRVTEEHITMD